MQAHPPLRPPKLLQIHPPRILQQPLLLCGQPAHQRLIPRHDQCVGLQIQRIAALRIIRRADKRDAGARIVGGGDGAVGSGQSDPEAFGVVGPAVGLADGAAAPFAEGDGAGEVGAAGGFEEAAREEGVGCGEHAGDAFAAEEAVGFGRGGEDDVGGGGCRCGCGWWGGAAEEEGCDGWVRVEVAGREEVPDWRVARGGEIA